MKKWLTIICCCYLVACSKNNADNPPYVVPPDTYITHQFKDRLIAAAITTKLGSYFNNADSFLNCKYDVTAYRVTYTTHDYTGAEIKASGLVYIPDIRYYFVPLVSYQHGTAISKGEVPSITGDVDYYVPFMLASETGAIVCAPDYIGLGFSEGTQHYFEPTDEANAVIDLLRSVGTLLNKTFRPLALSKELFLTGYSQGGHATLSAQRMLETTYRYEFNIKASAPMASFFSLEKSSQLNVLKDSIAYPFAAVYPFLLYSLQTTQHVYAGFSSMLKPPYDSLTQILFDGNYTSSYINTLFPEYPYTALQASFVNELKNNPANALMNAVKRYDIINDWIPKTPTRFYHSEGDEIVFYDNSVIAYNTFKQKGGNVSLVDLGHMNHLDGNFAAIQQMRSWFYPLLKITSY